MGWKAYRLVYRAKSPIHIGWHTLGYIRLTRYYIPGKNMWASFTDNLARADKNIKDIKDDISEIYQKYSKELLNKSIFISYFYPALDPDIPLLPRYTDEGLKYGNCSAAGFERLFIKSYGQTAVLPESNTAEDESLHESEFIAPVVEDENTKEQMPVYFVGYIFVKDESESQWETIKESVKEIFVGGDRKYGWGRLKLIEEYTRPENISFFGYTMSLDTENGNPKITIPYNKPIPAHIPIDSNIKLKGDIEPLVGREWGSKGAGQEIKLRDEKIYWMPGSLLQLQLGKPLQIGPYGILK